MARYDYYVQCEMQKPGYDVERAFIPERFARVGGVVGLKNPDGTWDEGWTVIGCGVRVAQNELRNKEHERYRARNDA